MVFWFEIDVLDHLLIKVKSSYYEKFRMYSMDSDNFLIIGWIIIGIIVAVIIIRGSSKNNTSKACLIRKVDNSAKEKAEEEARKEVEVRASAEAEERAGREAEERARR